MWPQLSRQLMIGVGTPMATQVKVTVWPREAWIDSWGGVTTWGGTGRRKRSEGCEGQREEEGVNGSEESGGREVRLRLWRGTPGTQPGDPSSPPSSLLTAAKLVTAVGTVALLITVEAGRDACVRGDAAELCGPTHILGVLGSWGTEAGDRCGQRALPLGRTASISDLCAQPTLPTSPRCSQGRSLTSPA